MKRINKHGLSEAHKARSIKRPREYKWRQAVSLGFLKTK